jgi:anaerobic ribonucleoside-triphosphate reductase activating protein
MTVDEIFEEICGKPWLRGVTFSGGEPFEQVPALLELAKNIRGAGLTLMSYSGYTLEELEATLMKMAAEDPEVPVLVRGDERLDYGSVMNVVKVVYKCKVRRMALVTVEK